MRRVNVHEAKTQLSKLLEAVEHGERVVIARAGTPVAVVVPYKNVVRNRKLGLFRGQAVIHADFDELPPDIASAFGATPALKLLLDTHVLLWAATAPEELNAATRTALEDGANTVAVSIVSAWEIAIKQSLGKLELPDLAETWLPNVLRRTGFEVAELGLSTALHVRSLPWHHRDPFDRLLVAHALESGYSLVTRDGDLRRYGVHVVDA